MPVNAALKVEIEEFRERVGDDALGDDLRQSKGFASTIAESNGDLDSTTLPDLNEAAAAANA